MDLASFLFNECNLSSWLKGNEDPSINATFKNNADFIEAQDIVDTQASKVADLKQNVTQARNNLHVERQRIIDLAIFSLLIMATVTVSYHQQ